MIQVFPGHSRGHEIEGNDFPCFSHHKKIDAMKGMPINCLMKCLKGIYVHETIVIME
jgi:hypothetical protein